MDLASLSRLGTETRNPGTKEIDRVSTLEMVKMINAEDQKVALAVEKEAPAIAAAVDAIAARLGQGGRLIYIGAGTSGRLGVLDASECPPTFSVDPGLVVGLIAGGDRAIRSAVENAEDDREAAAGQLREIGLCEKDAVCGIAASGRTPYVEGGLQYAKGCGCLTLCVTNNKNAPLAKHCAVAIEVEVGPEVLTGSTRLKSGTAQKMVLNMLTTGAMVRLGKTCGNLMVDLVATNEKLRVRCLNILKALQPQKSEEEMAAALQAAGGRVKPAALMLAAGMDFAQAQQALERHRGFLRAALEEAGVALP